MIKPKTVAQILETAQIEDVVSDYVQLKRSGANLKGLCPFHQEKTPSFVVSPAKNLCKCFGCGKGGSPVGFLMEHDNLSYPDALRRLAQRYNIPVEETQRREPTEEERKERQLKESLLILNQFAAEYYQQQMHDTDIGKSTALNYFKERGFRENAIKTFGLGYAPKGPSALLDKATAEGYKPELLEKLGLLNNRGQDFFKQRVIFPIHDKSGKVIAFAGRILGSGKNTKAPKYINSPETEIYHKSHVLYGLFQARQAIRKESQVILVEGYTDVLSMHQAGIENVVASSGTSLTQGQLALIKRLTNQLLILYDGDAAGIKAALRGLNIALQQDVDVKIALLPEGHDPDSFARKMGKTKFREYLDSEAKDFIRFQADILVDSSQSPAEKAAAVDTIIESLSYIPDALKRALYIKESSSRFGLSEQVITDRSNKLILKRQKQQLRREQYKAQSDPSWPTEEGSISKQFPPQPELPTDPVGPLEHVEREVARILICFGCEDYDDDVKISDYLLEHIGEVADEFDNLLYGRIVRECIEAKARKKYLSISHFRDHVDDEVRKLALGFLQSPYEYSENWEKRYRILLQTQQMPEKNFIPDVQKVLIFFQENKYQQMRTEVVRHLEKLQAGSEKDQAKIPVYMKALMDISAKMQKLSLVRGAWHK